MYEDFSIKQRKAAATATTSKTKASNKKTYQLFLAIKTQKIYYQIISLIKRSGKRKNIKISEQDIEKETP